MSLGMKCIRWWWIVGSLAACGPSGAAPRAPQEPAASVPTADIAAPGDTRPSGPDPATQVLQLVEPVKTGMTVGGVTDLCDHNLDRAKQLLASIREVDPADPTALTWERTAGRLDDAFLAINNASEFP